MEKWFRKNTTSDGYFFLDRSALQRGMAGSDDDDGRFQNGDLKNPHWLVGRCGMAILKRGRWTAGFSYKTHQNPSKPIKKIVENKKRDEKTNNQ